MIEQSTKLINELLDSDQLSIKDKNYLNKELYTSRGLGLVYLNKPRRWNAIVKKTMSKCDKCGNLKLLKNLYSYIDENNISITKNAPELCNECIGL